MRLLPQRRSPIRSSHGVSGPWSTASRAREHGVPGRARGDRRDVPPPVAAPALRPGQRGRHATSVRHGVQAGRLDHGQVQAAVGRRGLVQQVAAAAPARRGRGAHRPAGTWPRPAPAGRPGSSPARRPGPQAGGRPGPARPPRARLGSAAPSRSPARRPAISASVSELEASRLAPCTPVEAASPTA